MKRLILFFCLCLSTAFLSSIAQEPGQINVGVIVPDYIENMEQGQINRLRTKIEQICTSNGISAGYVPDGFVIYPSFELYEPEIVEGGMRPIYQVRADMTLFIRQVGRTGVASVSKQLRGNGTSLNQAIVNAIASIKVQDSDFKEFMQEGKEKISAFYEQVCAASIIKADGMVQREEYEAAIALLMSMPETVSCYEEITQKTVEIYNRNKDKLCRSWLNAAQAAAAQRDYAKATECMVQIAPSSDCQMEVEKLIQHIADKIDAKEKQAWDFAMKQYNDQLEMKKEDRAFEKEKYEDRLDMEKEDRAFEKATYKDRLEMEKYELEVNRETTLATIEAAKEVAKVYYSNQPDVQYTQIIK